MIRTVLLAVDQQDARLKYRGWLSKRWKTEFMQNT